jgi:hypothetical protein
MKAVKVSETGVNVERLWQTDCSMLTHAKMFTFVPTLEC